MKGTVKPKQDFMLVRPRPDIHGRLCTIALEGGVIDSAVFGRVKAGSVRQYKHTGVANNFAFGEVVRLGSGFAYGPSAELPDVQEGSIIGFDLCRVAISGPSQEGGTGEDGAPKPEQLFWLPFRDALCRFDSGARLPTPLGNYIMTERDDAAMGALLSGGQADGQRPRIILPDAYAGKGMATNDNPGTKIKYAVEKVVGVGPGRFIRKVWQAPDAVVDEYAIFVPVMSVELDAFSVRHRFTPWTSIMGCVEL